MSKTHPLPLYTALLVLGLGCTSVPLRPDGTPGPQKCPDEALEAMRMLGIHPGDTAPIVIETSKFGQKPLALPDGLIEGYLKRNLGKLPAVTRLYGQVWTGGTAVVIRYYEVRYPQGGTFPFCGIVLNEDGGLNKQPGSSPGIGVIQDDYGTVQAVSAFP
jgi:hypothetical protein